MSRELSDPKIARRLVDFVEGIASGRTAKKAAADANLDFDVAIRFLKSVGAQVAASVPSSPDPVQLPSGTKKRAGKKVGKLTAYTDGASRGNPGAAACAVIFYDDSNEELLRRSKRLGVATNNVAEYEGVLLALEFAQTLGADDLDIKLDSELVVKQLKRQYKVKHPTLKPLYEKARVMIGAFRRVNVTHIPRADNKLADKLANDELDGKT
jgi:ribonuclease HI